MRIVAASNRDLLTEISAGRFREDLFPRLAVGVLHLPPLRQRREDIGLLVEHCLARINNEAGSTPGWKTKSLAPAARNRILQHHWPGNVRELMNTLARAAIWTPGALIRREDLEGAMISTPGKGNGDALLSRSLGNGFNLTEVLGEVARHYLQRALQEAGGNKTQAAELVGLKNYQTFTNWLKKYQ